MKRKIHVALLLCLLPCAFCVRTPAQGTAFTYQGRLNDGPTPAAGTYDLRFAIYDSSGGMTVVGGPTTNSAIRISNGLFAVTLNPGAGVFTGGARWLEISVRTNGSAVFSTLSPRHPVLPEPYAIHAGSVNAEGISGSILSASLSGTYANAVTFSHAGNRFTGNGSALTNVNAARLEGLSSSNFWQISGNSNTTPGAHFLGTTDNRPLEMKVNGRRVLRIEHGGGDSIDSDAFPDGAPNLIGGSQSNFVGALVVGAAISGGGATNFGFVPGPNAVLADYGTIGGGVANRIEAYSLAATIGGGRSINIGTNSSYSVIAGGYNNNIATNSGQGTIGGGYLNGIGGDAPYGVIGGGYDNNIASGAWHATIAGGILNEVGTNSDHSMIGGGRDNKIARDSHYGVIAGGSGNDIGIAANDGTIGGGTGNIINVLSDYATIGGGSLNHISTNSDFSVIGGGSQNAIAASAPYATIPGGLNNSASDYGFAAGRRAKGNHQGAFVWGDSTDADIASTTGNSVTMRAAGGFRFFSDAAATVGVRIPFGGNAWSPMSDRNMKENVRPIDPRAILEKVAALPVTEWNLVSQPRDIRHLGPMAQDFKAAFGLGEDDRHISTSDADGVALAAIQGLNQKLEEKDAEIQSLKKRLADLEKFIRTSFERKDSNEN